MIVDLDKSPEDRHTLHARRPGRRPVVGDSLRDLKAAASAGAQPVLVRTGKGEYTLADPDPVLKNVQVFDDLGAFTEHLLAQE